MVVMASTMNGLSSAARAAARFMADERGATAIEYALIASGIGAAIAAIVFGVGGSVVNNLYGKVASLL
jgi:pilus assembly protein Flp/PilA